MAEGQVDRFFRFLLLILSLTGVLSCREPEPYRLGFIGALTGNNSVLGIDGRNGFLLAVEEQNDKGGIRGRPVVISIRNGEMNPDIAVRQLEELHNEGVEAVIGPFTSSQTAALLPLADREGLLIFSPTSSSQRLTGLDDMLFKAASPTSDSSRSYAEYMIGRAGLTTSGIIFDRVNSTFSESWISEFSDLYLSLGGRIVYSQGIDARLNTDYSDILEGFLHSEAEALLLVTNSIDTSNLIQHLRLMNSTATVFISGWASSTQLIELGGKSVDGTIILQSYNPFDESDTFRTFIETYHSRFGGPPSFASILTYETANIIFRGLAEKSEKETLKDALLRIRTFEGLQEQITFDRYGDTHRGSVMSIIENGTIRKLE